MLRKTVIAILIVLIIYTGLIRPWILRMGATDQEVAALMPGDGLVSNPSMKYTQAVTIHAPREIVWAYLVQVGYRRAGWYNWDFINRMADPKYFYEGGRSANRIIPELQQLQAGDKIFLTPQLGMDVEKIQPNETLMLTGRENERYLVVWTYWLQDLGNDNTRLLVRWTSNQNEGPGLKILNFLVIEPGGAGIQQSQMLRGIKARAERDFQQEKATNAVQPG
jgi:hypothetical protein